jgi:hypothetical protein
MLKKTFAALAVAGALLLVGASAASAYPVEPPAGAVSNPAPGLGEPITLTATIPADSPQDFAIFTLSGGDGATLASIVRTAAGASVTKPISNGQSSAVFTSATEGVYTIVATDSNGKPVASFSLAVSAANGNFLAGGAVADSGTIASGVTGLPATGGEIPLTAIWIGAGALGLGGIATVAAVARRRSQTGR